VCIVTDCHAPVAHAVGFLVCSKAILVSCSTLSERRPATRIVDRSGLLVNAYSTRSSRSGASSAFNRRFSSVTDELSVLDRDCSKAMSMSASLMS